MKSFLIYLSLIGCAWSPSDVSEGEVLVLRSADEQMIAPEILDAGLNASDACMHKRIYLSQWNGKGNPDCPPELVSDPIEVPLWDPSPIIK